MSASVPSDGNNKSEITLRTQAAYCASVINHCGQEPKPPITCRPVIAERMLRILGNAEQVIEVAAWAQQMLRYLPVHRRRASGLWPIDHTEVLQHDRDYLEALLLGFGQVPFGRRRICDALSAANLHYPRPRSAAELKKMIAAAAVFVGDRR